MMYRHASHLKKEIRLRENLDIAAATDATTVARLFLRRTLESWGASRIVDDMLSVGTELVTNAIKECQKATESGQQQLNPASKLIRLRLLGFASTVAVEVWDRCPGQPQLLPLDLDRENGRGLYLVDALSLQWGFYPMRPWGKVVWSELDVYPQRISA